MLPQTPLPEEELARRCRGVGLRATPQRLAVYRTLLEAHDHPTPEGLYRAVRERLPSVALGTIYKILDSLEAAGLVDQVSLLWEAKRYDGNREPHHHLVCRACKRVTDFTDPTLAGPLPDVEGFVALEVRVQVVGLCAACHAAGSRGP